MISTVKEASKCQVIFTKSQPVPAFLFEIELLLLLPVDDEENLFIYVFNCKSRKKD